MESFGRFYKDEDGNGVCIYCNYNLQYISALALKTELKFPTVVHEGSLHYSGKMAILHKKL